MSNRHKTSQKKDKKQFLCIMMKGQIVLTSDKIDVSTNIMSQMREYSITIKYSFIKKL